MNPYNVGKNLPLLQMLKDMEPRLRMWKYHVLQLCLRKLLLIAEVNIVKPDLISSWKNNILG